MRVSKTRKPPPHREIALLLDKDTILLEDGTEWPYKATPNGTKVYARREVIRDIFFNQKLGEVLKYDGDIIKWRLKCPDRYKSRTVWRNDAKEVSVINSSLCPDDPIKTLEAYCEWREWVESEGGNIVGTIASTSWSLFRASLKDGTWNTPYKGISEIDHPIGGRILPCKSLWTTFQGDLIQWDLYSAYSRRLSELAFGGDGCRWKEFPLHSNFDKAVERGLLVYIQGRVQFTNGSPNLGPLPERRKIYSARPTSNLSYPTSGTMAGIWTYEEFRDARDNGCRVEPEHAYVHIATGKRYYHYDWYKIIQQGRGNLDGYARSLVKQTGNSLWGRYAMRLRPAKTVWRNVEGRREWIQHTVRTSKRNQCMELADQLCGKIRSDLYGLAISAGSSLLQGNTDGAWVENKEGWLPPSNDWRIKKRATRLDIMDDATYRYWEEGIEEATYVVPGVNTDYTEEYFDKHWEKHFEA